MQAKILPFTAIFDGMDYYFWHSELYNFLDECLERSIRCRIPQRYYLLLEIDREDTSFAWLKQNQFILLLLWSQAHLALVSPCNSFDRFKVSFIYEITLLLQINWEPSNNVRYT